LFKYHYIYSKILQIFVSFCTKCSNIFQCVPPARLIMVLYAFQTSHGLTCNQIKKSFGWATLFCSSSGLNLARTADILLRDPHISANYLLPVWRFWRLTTCCVWAWPSPELLTTGATVVLSKIDKSSFTKRKTTIYVFLTSWPKTEW
jgi:hypothetical protein